MSLLSRIIGSRGCKQHHFEEYKVTGRVRLSGFEFRHSSSDWAEYEKVSTCEHQGCEAQNVIWKTVHESEKLENLWNEKIDGETVVSALDIGFRVKNHLENPNTSDSDSLREVL